MSDAPPSPGVFHGVEKVFHSVEKWRDFFPWRGKPALAAALAALLAGAVAAPAAAGTGRAAARSKPGPGATPPERVVLALKWYHQFQSAGYYAALRKGFYAEEGLDVSLRVPEDGLFAVEAVLSGRADFGVASADLIRTRAEGKPVVALAAVFQHSPVVLTSRADRGLREPEDFVGRTVMSGPDDMPEIKSMFRKAGVRPESVTFVPHRWSIEPVLAGEVDGSVDYLGNEPYLMRARGVEPHLLRPLDYGVDFYADTLFTTEEQIRRHPERVAAFRRASLRGWTYALENPAEVAGWILEMPGVRERGKTREHLLYEADWIAELMRASLVEIGHMNPERWRRIAQTLEEFGAIPAGWTLEGFLYDPGEDGAALRTVLGYALWGAAAMGLLAAGIAYWNHKLRGAVRRKTRDLKESESKWRSYVDGAPYGIFIADSKGRLVEANPAACALSGYSRQELLGMGVRDLLAQESVGEGEELAREALRAGLQGGEVLFRTKAGQYRWGAVAVRKVAEDRYVGFCDDVTDRKRTAEMLIHAQKLDSIGQLAGGVAHDFNNMLAVILGNVEMALESVPVGQPAHADLLEIRKAAERSAELTRQLLGFARKQTVVPKVLDLNETLDGMLKMLRRLIGARVELDWKPGKNVWPIRVDPTQIDQILVNLCVNARDAVGDGGRIGIETGTAVFGEEDCLVHAGAIAGDYCWVAVSDNGRGMEANLLPHIFEPFFTTKGVGKGTGLGLATVYGIVKQNNGFIGVDSAPGKGTVFTIYLPRFEAPVDVPPPRPVAEKSAPTRETILLVEDEAAILVMVRNLLERRGYRVLAASDPVRALDMAAKFAEKIDLLITDVVMPEMSGRDFAAKLLETRPETKCLYMSGHTPEALVRQDALGVGVRFIQKPFTIKALFDKVVEALDSGGQRGRRHA